MKAPFPIDITESGMVMLVSPDASDASKAPTPIDVTESGMVMLVSPDASKA